MAHGKDRQIAGTVHVFLILTMAVLTSRTGLASDTILAKEGKAMVNIVLPANPERAEEIAARELAAYLGKITGGKFAVTRESDQRMSGLLVGRTRPARSLIEALKKEKGNEEEAYLIKTIPDGLVITGVSPYGTLHGAYFFLERLGCRWFMPGTLGEVFPKEPTLVVGELNESGAPDMKLRQQPRPTFEDEPPFSEFARQQFVWADLETSIWARRNHLGGWPGIVTYHNYDLLVPPNEYFTKHPEYYSLIKGQRRPPPDGTLCVSNPEVGRIATENVRSWLRGKPASRAVVVPPPDWGPDFHKVVFVTPPDGMNIYCECPACAKMVHNGNYHDQILYLANAVARGIRDEFPNAYVGFLADYHCPGLPETVQPEPNVLFEITQLILQQSDGDYSKPVSHPRNARMAQALAGWGRYGNPLMVYTYYGHPGLMGYWPIVHCLRQDIPCFFQKGVVGLCSETHCHWATQGLHIYLFPRLLWNTKADVDALLDDYYQKFYGPAAEPMRNFWTRLEKNMEAQGFIVGFMFPGDILKICPADLLHLLEQDLAKAFRLASQDAVVTTRLQLVAKGLQYNRMLIKFQKALANYDDERVVQEGETLLHFFQELRKDPSPQAVELLTAPGQVEYGIKTAKERMRCAAALRAKSTGEMRLPLTWLFRLDPRDEGRKAKWYAPEYREKDWKPIQIGNWKEHGYPNYDGVAWYRVECELPASFKEQAVFVNFGGVDEEAWVWLNGEFIGEHTAASTGQTINQIWNQPFNLKVGKAARFGEKNTFVVRVNDTIGAAGIYCPVALFAAPAKKILVSSMDEIGGWTAAGWTPEESLPNTEIGISTKEVKEGKASICFKVKKKTLEEGESAFLQNMGMGLRLEDTLDVSGGQLMLAFWFKTNRPTKSFHVVLGDSNKTFADKGVEHIVGGEFEKDQWYLVVWPFTEDPGYVHDKEPDGNMDFGAIDKIEFYTNAATFEGYDEASYYLDEVQFITRDELERQYGTRHGGLMKGRVIP